MPKLSLYRYAQIIILMFQIIHNSIGKLFNLSILCQYKGTLNHDSSAIKTSIAPIICTKPDTDYFKSNTHGQVGQGGSAKLLKKDKTNI